LQWIL